MQLWATFAVLFAQRPAREFTEGRRALMAPSFARPAVHHTSARPSPAP